MSPQSHRAEYTWEVQVPWSRPWLRGGSNGIGTHGIPGGSAQGSVIGLLSAQLEMEPSSMSLSKACLELRERGCLCPLPERGFRRGGAVLGLAKCAAQRWHQGHRSSPPSPCLPRSLTTSAVAPGKHPCIISSGQKDPSLPRAMEAMDSFPETPSGTLLTTCRPELGSHISD